MYLTAVIDLYIRHVLNKSFRWTRECYRHALIGGQRLEVRGWKLSLNDATHNPNKLSHSEGGRPNVRHLRGVRHLLLIYAPKQILHRHSEGVRRTTEESPRRKRVN